MTTVQNTIPAAAVDADEMARRVYLIAVELAAMGIKPTGLHVSYGYLWGLPGDPGANDVVSVQVGNAADFLRLEAAFELSRAEDDGAGNCYASGIAGCFDADQSRGVAVQVYTRMTADLEPARVRCACTFCEVSA